MTTKWKRMSWGALSAVHLMMVVCFESDSKSKLLGALLHVRDLIRVLTSRFGNLSCSGLLPVRLRVGCESVTAVHPSERRENSGCVFIFIFFFLISSLFLPKIPGPIVLAHSSSSSLLSLTQTHREQRPLLQWLVAHRAAIPLKCFQ